MADIADAPNVAAAMAMGIMPPLAIARPSIRAVVGSSTQLLRSFLIRLQAVGFDFSF